MICQKCFRPDAKSHVPEVPMATVCRGCAIELERTIGWLRFYGLQLSLPETTTTLAQDAPLPQVNGSQPATDLLTTENSTTQTSQDAPQPPKTARRPRKAAEAPRIAN